jgi:hypothetical protein
MKLTAAERRRLYLAQQYARHTMLSRPLDAQALGGSRTDRRGLRRALKAAVIVMLLGGAVFAARLVEFHRPASLVEALLPRL